MENDGKGFVKSMECLRIVKRLGIVSEDLEKAHEDPVIKDLIVRAGEGYQYMSDWQKELFADFMDFFGVRFRHTPEFAAFYKHPWFRNKILKHEKEQREDS